MHSNKITGIVLVLMQKTKYLTFAICFILVYACSGDKIEKITIQTPNELQENSKAVALIADMTNAVNNSRTASVKIARAEANDKSPGMLKMMFIGFQFAKAQGKMEECINKANELQESLSDIQYGSLISCLKSLEQKSTDIDPKTLGLTEEKLAELITIEEQKMNELPHIQQLERQGVDSLNKYRGEASGFMDDDFNKGEVIEMPRFMHILFPVLVIGLIVFLGIRRIKIFFGRTKEIGYTISSTKSKINEAKEKLEQEGYKDSIEYQNAKKAIDFLDNITNKDNS